MASRRARYRKVFSVLAKHGFNDVIALLSGNAFFRFFRFSRASFDSEQFKKDRWIRLRKVLEELGPTWVKFGQILSSRPGLLPDDLTNELTKLQDAVPPFSHEDVIRQFEDGMGVRPETLFESFETIPIASASIAQVHRAVTKDGRKVAVKIRRPDISSIIRSDILLMRDIAAILSRTKEFASVRPKKLVDVFEKSILEELDFEAEAQHVKWFHDQFDGDSSVKIPEVYHEYSGKNVVTLEFLDGIKIRETDELVRQGYDLKIIAKQGFEAYFKMIFEWGYFHADPHPGNILILPGNVIGILDFGMMGRLSNQDRLAINEFIIALGNDDSERIVENIERIQGGEVADKKSLERDIMEFIHEFGAKSVKDINLNEALEKGRKMIFKHELQLNPDFFLLIRTISLLEGIGIRLNPKFRSLEMIKPYALKLMRRNLNPINLLKKKALLTFFGDFSQLLLNFPSDWRKINEKIKNGKFVIQTENQSTKMLAEEIKKTGKLISYTLLSIMFFAGGFLFKQTSYKAIVFELPVLSVISFSLSLLFILLILRKGK